MTRRHESWKMPCILHRLLRLWRDQREATNLVKELAFGLFDPRSHHVDDPDGNFYKTSECDKG